MKSQKIGLENLNPRLRNFPRKVPRTKEKRKRNDTDSEDDSRTKYCAICKYRGDPFWTHNTTKFF